MKGVQHIDHTLELDGVDRPERVTVKVRYDLQNARAAESVKRLGVGMLAALLGRPERKADAAFDLQWKLEQVVFQGADKFQRCIGVAHSSKTNIGFLL